MKQVPSSQVVPIIYKQLEFEEGFPTLVFRDSRLRLPVWSPEALQQLDNPTRTSRNERLPRMYVWRTPQYWSDIHEAA